MKQFPRFDKWRTKWQAQHGELAAQRVELLSRLEALKKLQLQQILKTIQLMIKIHKLHLIKPNTGFDSPSCFEMPICLLQGPLGTNEKHVSNLERTYLQLWKLGTFK